MAGLHPGATGREGWEVHWLRTGRAVDLRAAAVAFLGLAILAGCGLGFGAQRIERFYYDVNQVVNHRDVRQLNLQDDQLLQTYLKEQPAAGTSECVLVGASLTATAHEQSAQQRLHGRLAAQLNSLTGKPWRCTNLATDSAVTWTYFYNARLLRRYRPPEVLIVGIDSNFPRDRNAQLVLNAGVRSGDLTPGELSYAVPYNRQLLYVCEANTLKWLRDSTRLFKALHYASYSYPTRRDAVPWARFLVSQVRNQPPPPVRFADNFHADGTPKSWLEVPGNKARIEYYKAQGGVPQVWDERMPAEYEMLFRELEACQEAGMRVIVVAMPRNPALPHLLGPMPDCVAQSARQHGIEFHDYWLSGLIPSEYFMDYGHFFGDGCEIMARELAGLITAAPQQTGTGGRP